MVCKYTHRVVQPSPLANSRTSSSPQKRPRTPNSHSPPPSPGPLAPPIPRLSLWIRLLQGPHTSGVESHSLCPLVSASLTEHHVSTLLRSVRVAVCVSVSFFSQIHNIPLCGCTTFPVPTPLSVDVIPEFLGPLGASLTSPESGSSPHQGPPAHTRGDLSPLAPLIPRGALLDLF